MQLAHPVGHPSRTALSAVAVHPPRHCHLSDQTIGTQTQPGSQRCSHAHPALRLGGQSQHSSALPGPRWRVSQQRGRAVFHEARAPSAAELETLLNRIIQRIVKLLTRTGYLIEEQGMTYLAQAESDRALTPLQAAACTYRIAAQGHTRGKKC